MAVLDQYLRVPDSTYMPKTNLLRDDINEVADTLLRKIKFRAQGERVAVHVLENGEVVTRVDRVDHGHFHTKIGVYTEEIGYVDLVAELRAVKAQRMDPKENAA